MESIRCGKMMCCNPNCLDCYPKSIDSDNRVEALIRYVAKGIADILVRKNHDYGDSVHKNYEQFGDLTMLIRLSDKMGRLVNLTKQVDMRVNESIEDVYRDIAGYAILALVSRARLDLEKTSKDYPSVTESINCANCRREMIIPGVGVHYCVSCHQGHEIRINDGHMVVFPSNDSR